MKKLLVWSLLVGTSCAYGLDRVKPRISGLVRLGELEGLREGGQGRDGFPESYYRERCGEKIVRRAGPPEGLEVEVAVVGAGLTGLCTALALAERGHRVVVLESKRVGWAASGRNGGVALPGLSGGAGELLGRVGG